MRERQLVAVSECECPPNQGGMSISISEGV